MLSELTLRSRLEVFLKIHILMEDFILQHQPRLWIHGHTHESFDYKIGKTRVVCNPRGYAAIEENKGFRPDFTLVV
jgi:hypothetical protein